MNTIIMPIPEAITVHVKHIGEQTLSLRDMSPEWFAWAIANGVRQSAGDADAGKAAGGESITAVREKYARIASGEIPSGGRGGARVDDVERQLREDVAGLLRTWGWKAKNIPTDARAALEAGIGVKMKGAAEADIAAAVTAAYDTLHAKAKATVDARNAAAADIGALLNI